MPSSEADSICTGTTLSSESQLISAVVPSSSGNTTEAEIMPTLVSSFSKVKSTSGSIFQIDNSLMNDKLDGGGVLSTPDGTTELCNFISWIIAKLKVIIDLRISELCKISIEFVNANHEQLLALGALLIILAICMPHIIIYKFLPRCIRLYFESEKDENKSLLGREENSESSSLSSFSFFSSSQIKDENENILNNNKSKEEKGNEEKMDKWVSNLLWLCNRIYFVIYLIVLGIVIVKYREILFLIKLGFNVEVPIDTGDLNLDEVINSNKMLLIKGIKIIFTPLAILLIFYFKLKLKGLLKLSTLFTLSSLIFSVVMGIIFFCYRVGFFTLLGSILADILVVVLAILSKIPELSGVLHYRVIFHSIFNTLRRWQSMSKNYFLNFLNSTNTGTRGTVRKTFKFRTTKYFLADPKNRLRFKMGAGGVGAASSFDQGNSANSSDPSRNEGNSGAEQNPSNISVPVDPVLSVGEYIQQTMQTAFSRWYRNYLGNLGVVWTTHYPNLSNVKIVPRECIIPSGFENEVNADPNSDWNSVRDLAENFPQVEKIVNSFVVNNEVARNMEEFSEFIPGYDRMVQGYYLNTLRNDLIYQLLHLMYLKFYLLDMRLFLIFKVQSLLHHR